MIFELAEDFSAALAAMPAEQPQRHLLQLLEEAIRRDIHFLERHRVDQPQALFQCLWNSGWWYDSPESAAHYQPAEFAARLWAALKMSAREEQDPWLHTGAKLSTLMEGWKKAKEAEQGAFPWLRATRPPAFHLGSAQRRVCRGHDGAVHAVVLLAGGSRMASAGIDRTLRIWDEHSGQELECIPAGPAIPLSLAASPDGELMAVGSDDGSLRLFGASPVQELWSREAHGSQVNTLDFTPDGMHLVSGGRDGMVRVWQTAGGNLLHELADRMGPVRGVRVSPDGKRIASVGRDGAVRVWELASGTLLRRMRRQRRELTCVCWSPDGSQLATGSLEGAQLWEADTGRRGRRFTAHAPWVEALVFSPDGRSLLGGGDPFGSIWVWDIGSGGLVRTLRGHDGPAKCLCLAGRPGEVCSASADGTVRRWDWQGAAQRHVLKGHLYAPGCMAFSPDGRTIATGASDGDVRTWDVETGHCLLRLKGHRGTIYFVAYSPDGQWIVSTSHDRTVRIWHAGCGRRKQVLKGLAEPAHEACFSRDNRWIATRVAGGGVWIWERGRVRFVLPPIATSSPWERIECSGDRKRFDFLTAREVWRWDTSRSQEVDGPYLRVDGSTCLWRAELQANETQIFGVAGLIASYPSPLPGGSVAWTPATSPSGVVWAGEQEGHLQIIRLEGVFGAA